MADRLLRSRLTAAMVIAFCLVLCVCVLPSDDTDAYGTLDPADPNEPERHPCGNDAEYTIENGVLTITGTGAIYDGGWDSWISEVQIGYGITDIREGTFENMTSLRTVDFPSTLSDIGPYAFSGCSNLDIGDIECEDIGEYAFQDCSSIRNLSVDCSSVEYGAFSGCNNLRSLSIYCGTVYGYAFMGCNNLDNVSMSCSSVKGDAFHNCGSLKLVEVRGGTFGSGAFSGCVNLRTLEIGSSAYLGDGSLYDMRNVSHVSYSSKRSLDESPFAAYGFADNTSCSVTVNMTSVPENLFRNCDSISHVLLPSSVASVSSSAFQGCYLDSITFDGNKFSDFTESPFKGIMKDFTVTYSTSYIPANFMDGVSHLSAFNMDAEVNVSKIGEYAFNESKALFNFEMAAGTDKHAVIGNHAFDSNSGQINISTAAEEGCFLDIGELAFRGVTGVIHMSDVAYDINVGQSAFEGSSITGFGNAKLATLGDKAFLGCNALRSVDISQHSTKVGNYVFQGCESLDSLTYNAPDAEIGEYAFYGLSDNTNFHIGVNIKSIQEGLLRGSDADVYIDGAPTTVGASALKDCTVIDSSTSWNSLKAIGADAFDGCQFTRGDFSGMNGVTVIGENAFTASNLTRIVLPVSLTTMGPDILGGCESLTLIQIDKVPSNYNEGGYSMFVDAGSPGQGMTVKFGSLVKVVPEALFLNSNNLENIDLTNVETVARNAFAGTSVSELTFPQELKSVASEAFANCYSLDNMVFLNSELSFGHHVFLTDEEHLDTDITCQRHSTASDYPWADDKRDKHIDYTHVEGEYTGMMEILFNILEAIFGASIANDIIDFFFDNVALNILESIDLGSTEKNEMLLVAIALGLLLLLFVFLFIDVSEGIRVMEILLATATAIIIALNTVRLLVEYPDWYSYLSILVIAGITVPLVSGIYQIRSKRYPREGETLLRLYSLDNNSINDIARGPWRFMRELPSKEPYYKYVTLTKIPRALRFLILLLVAPAGLILSAVYSVSFLLFHLPAFAFSWILVKVFSAKDRTTGKHVSHCICPDCGKSFPVSYYRCECGQVHKDLSSGKYGVHKAICGKCYAKLVCSYRGRRWETSTEICPECGEAIWIGEAEPFACSMIGATDSGKTSLVSEAYKFAKSRPGFSVSFPSPGTAKLVNEDDESGIPTDGRSEAIHTCLMTKEGGWETKGLYAYDVDGNYYSGSSLDAMPEPMEYTFADGMVLVINPYHMGDFSEEMGIPPVGVDINAVFSSFMTRYMGATNVGYDDKVKVPLAVVVTRCVDAGLRPSTLAEVKDDSNDIEIEEFLRDYGMDSLMNNLKLRFANVRLFAFDSQSDAGRSSAAVPFYWIMEQNNSKMEKWLD